MMDKLPITIDMTDTEIKEIAKKLAWNGHCISEICKNCGYYIIKAQRLTDNAEIVNICSKCFRTKNNQRIQKFHEGLSEINRYQSTSKIRLEIQELLLDFICINEITEAVTQF